MMNCKQCNKKISRTIIKSVDGKVEGYQLCKKCFNEKEVKPDE